MVQSSIKTHRAKIIVWYEIFVDGMDISRYHKISFSRKQKYKILKKLIFILFKFWVKQMSGNIQTFYVKNPGTNETL